MRSASAADYQQVPRPVAVMAKDFREGSSTGRHAHPRAQLLYAISGLMTAATDDGSWLVPEGHALLIPPRLEHDVSMHGAVAMRTAYLSPDTLAIAACRVLKVSPLLDAALLALAGEPVLYDPAGRGGHLAALVLDEVARAPEAPFALPLPSDGRLRRLCETLIDQPALGRDIDGWSQEVGMSRRTLTRRFRQETGLSFGEWRRRLRLQAAMTRRASGEAAVRIAARVGYADPRALEAMMRRTTRTS